MVPTCAFLVLAMYSHCVLSNIFHIDFFSMDVDQEPQWISNSAKSIALDLSSTPIHTGCLMSTTRSWRLGRSPLGKFWSRNGSEDKQIAFQCWFFQIVWDWTGLQFRSRSHWSTYPLIHWNEPALQVSECKTGHMAIRSYLDTKKNL